MTGVALVRGRAGEEDVSTVAPVHSPLSWYPECSLAMPVGTSKDNPCADVADDADLDKLPASLRAQCEQGTDMGDGED